MRIALFHNLPSGGAKRAVYEWTRRLVPRHSIDVFTVSTAEHDFCDLRPHVRRHHVYGFKPRRLFRPPFGRLNRLQRLRDLHSIELLEQRMAADIGKAKYDVFLAHASIFTTVPTLLKHVEIPSLYYLHEPLGRSVTRQFSRPYLRQNFVRQAMDRVDPLLYLYERRLYRLQRMSLLSVRSVLGNSQYTRQAVREEFGIDPKVCHCGVDCSLFYEMPEVEKSNTVMSVGEISARKGFDFLIESLGRIPPDGRPGVVIAANWVHEPEREYLENLANEKGVSLEVLVNLDNTQLRHLYNRARLCVYTPVMEPFGLVPLEAMACKLPVIGVREGGVEESIVHEKTGLLVERDGRQCASAIVHLLSNPVLAREYGCQGRREVEKNWTWERSVTRYEAYVDQLKADETERGR
jgi:glycosyltransferase involved in cell wall biosynthesis